MHPVVDLGEPFERLDEHDAADLLRLTFGVEAAQLDRLDTERDDTFRVRTAAGSYVLKVAHPDDDPLYVNMQTAAMSFAAEIEPLLPLQSLALSIEGEVEPVIEHGGRERVARLLTWRDGIPLGSAPKPDAAQLRILGETSGRLTSALSTFDHPAAHREFVWDVGRLELVRPLLDEYPMGETRELFAVYDRVVVPVIRELPQQVIHNDFHLGNIVVQPDSPGYITGVIDFGDTVHTARVADLAVALSYLVVPGDAGAEDLAAFRDGYESRVRLTDAERVVLPVLVAARIAQRILVNLNLARGNPDDRGSAIGSAETNRRALGALLPALLENI